MSEPVRESYLFLPSFAPAVLYATFFVSGLILLYGLYRHLKSYDIGLREFFGLVFREFGVKARRFAKFGLGQRKVLEGGSGGVMHGAMFYGFLMLLLYTTLIGIQSDVFPLFTNYVFLQGGFYLTLEFLGDVLGTAFIVGLAIALYRRYVQRLEKLETKWDDYVVLGGLVWIGITGFVLEALRFLATPSAWAGFSPVGDALSGLIGVASMSQGQAMVLYQGFWWTHMFSVFALIAVTPYTKLVHVFTSGVNVAVSPEKPMGKLNTPFNLPQMLATGNIETPPNVKSVKDLSPLRHLMLDACTNCGRCQEVCPAYASGRDLSPRLVIQDLGSQMFADKGKADVFASGVIREQEMWACTTCNACVNACPVLINQVDYIVDFRRTLVAENRLDSSKRMFLENIARSNNPFGLPQSDRQGWLRELGVPTIRENPGAEYLYWVGCQGSYDPRGRKITKAVVEVLKSAKVSFAVLGNEELCTGEPVRRMGEEGRFQDLAMRNIENMKTNGVKKVVVHCAHCFNTFLNEYPEFGADFKVVHHSQLIDELIRDGRLHPGKSSGKVTFHDPCNLGRINGVFDEPREVLSSQGATLVEMERNKKNSFCCGGGGANVWYQVPEKKKIGVIRVEEALETGADTLAVGCPFCVVMFEDAAKTLGREDSFKVKDIAEILAESLQGKEA